MEVSEKEDTSSKRGQSKGVLIEEELEKQKARKASIRDGSGSGIMNGFGVRYITPYALALGAGNTIIGLISSLPSFIFLLIIYTLLSVAGSFCAPAWGSWMKDLLGEERLEHLEKRTRIATLVELVSMLFAGVILEHFKKT